MTTTHERRPSGTALESALAADHIVPAATVTNNGDTFQPMPELNPEEYAALKANIVTNGIVVPVIIDQHGRIIDGHHRVRIAAELGIEYPIEVRDVASDEEAMDLAVTLNCNRRQLNREQVREVIAHETRRRPGDSDRAIARRVGCSHRTVAAVRMGGRVDKLSTSTWTPPDDVDQDLRARVLDVLDQNMNLTPALAKSDAEDRWMRNALVRDADNTLPLTLALVAGADTVSLAVAVAGRMALWRSCGMDRRRIHDLFDPWLDMVLSPSTREVFAAAVVKLFPRDESEIPEFIEMCIDLVASIPTMPDEVAA